MFLLLRNASNKCWTQCPPWERDGGEGYILGVNLFIYFLLWTVEIRPVNVFVRNLQKPVDSRYVLLYISKFGFSLNGQENLSYQVLYDIIEIALIRLIV